METLTILIICKPVMMLS